MKVFTIEHDGSTLFVALLSDAISQIPEEIDMEIDDEYIIGCCEMTEKEFCDLPEFEGF